MEEPGGPCRHSIWPGTVRAGRIDELDRLAAIEIDAARSLIEAGAIPADHLSATPRAVMERCVADGLLFVVPDDADMALGFLAATECDGALYIGEVDVWQRCQRRGIGRALMLAAIDEASRRRLATAMLTTDRFAPFNRAFYESMGFREVANASLPPALAIILKSEIEKGLVATRRIGMVLSIPQGSSPASGTPYHLPA